MDGDKRNAPDARHARRPDATDHRGLSRDAGHHRRTYYAFLGIIVFIYSIVAIGLNILSGYAGQFSLGHAAFMAMGAYTTALLTKALATISFFAQTGLHILLGVICGTVVAALSGIVLAVPALRVRVPILRW